MQDNAEQLIEEITNRLKQNGDVSDYKKIRHLSGIVTLLTQLNGLPKASVPNADFMRIKNQILDRIAVPEMDTQKVGWLASFPMALRFGLAAFGSLLIVVSLTLGVAVTAMQSAPGQLSYPLKKIVENIQLKLTPKDQQSNLQMKFAITRVDELNQILQQQRDGQISAQDAQKIVATTVNDLKKTTNAAAKSTSSQPKPGIVNKLADLSNKLQIASIKSEGEVKIELEKAVQSTQDSQAEAIKNLVEAGIKVDGEPVTTNTVSASGKLTAVSDVTINIGTAKFLITKDTKYVNLANQDLSVGQIVDIVGEIKDNKTYASQITLVSDPKVKGAETTKTDEPEPATQTETQNAQ
jgi:hypothetical protein